MSKDIISQYSRAGFALFSTGQGKKPIKEGVDWRLTPVDFELTRTELPQNYGVVIPDGILVIDVDCKHGAPGKESFVRLTEDAGLAEGWESETYVVQTGSGGFHIYLRVSKGFLPGKTLKKYPGIEFLTRRFYVIGPESVHPETHKKYKILFGSIDTIATAPEKLLDLLIPVKTETIAPAIPKDFVDDDPLNVDRFIEILRSMPEVPVGNQRNSCYIAACKGRDLGLSCPKTIEILRLSYNGIKLRPPIQDSEVTECTQSAYRYARGHSGSLNVSAIFQVAEVGEQIDVGHLAYDVSKKGIPDKTLNNAVNYIASFPEIASVFRYNTFTGNVEVSTSAPWYKERGGKGASLIDEDVILLKYFFTKTIKVEFPKEILFEAIVVLAHKRHYHPVRNYLSSLKWDGIKRLNSWLSTYGHAINTPYTSDIGRKCLCAAVRRVFEPGCKWDYVLIIEGAQGIGKSTACRILGRNWCGDMNLDPHQKDSIQMMMGKWVIELSEMTALRWADANALKSFITREKDTVRMAYERHAKDFLRQSIFIGTVNPEHVGYLNDITGNRRFWITKFNGPVDLVGLENDCDQLWAEAVLAYKTEALFLSGESERMQVVEAQARMPEDPMRTNVIRWLAENKDKEEINTIEILEFTGIPVKNITKADQSRVAQALVELGWEKRISRTNGIFETTFVRGITQKIDRGIEL